MAEIGSLRSRQAVRLLETGPCLLSFDEYSSTTNLHREARKTVVFTKFYVGLTNVYGHLAWAAGGDQKAFDRGGRGERPRRSQRKTKSPDYSPETYSATSRFSAKGHCLSIHCASQRKPVLLAMETTSGNEYLWLLSVQMVSPSLNLTESSATGIFTVC
jgi:hypothetical protein